MIKDANINDSKLLEEDDRIAAYIKGQLSTEEEQLFLKELEDNPKLKEKAIITARLVKGLNQVGEERDKDSLGTFLASNEQDVEVVAKQITRQRAKTISIRKASTWIAVAASVICIVWLGIDYADYKHTTELGEVYANAIPFDPSSGTIVRGEDPSEDAEKNLAVLFASVKNGENLENTIHELSLCWEKSTQDTANDYTDYYAEIGWYLAIAYLKDKNKNEAKKVLEIVLKKMETLDEADSNLGKKVKELQEKL